MFLGQTNSLFERRVWGKETGICRSVNWLMSIKELCKINKCKLTCDI